MKELLKIKRYFQDLYSEQDNGRKLIMKKKNFLLLLEEDFLDESIISFISKKCQRHILHQRVRY